MNNSMCDIFTILTKEINNTDRIRLYRDNDVWRAYERSAYLMSLILPSICSSKSVNHYYEIIIVSNTVCCEDCMNVLFEHEVVVKKQNYLEFNLSPMQISIEKFDEWKENILE